MSSRSRIRIAWLLAALLAIPSLSSCATAKKKAVRAKDSLEESARSYNEALRWGQFEKAVGFVAPEDRERFLASLQGASQKDVRYTEVRLGDIEIPASGTEDATVTVTRSFFRTNELSERSETLIQRWYRSGDRWFVRFEPPTK